MGGDTALFMRTQTHPRQKSLGGNGCSICRFQPLRLPWNPEAKRRDVSCYDMTEEPPHIWVKSNTGGETQMEVMSSCTGAGALPPSVR